MDYLQGLNQPQQDAVQHISGPLMIIAGAGSGKTRVLTYRTAHLIEKGVDPFQILLLTFTNKAAGEMRERIEKVIGNDAKNLWMGTFHSVFAKILRFDGKHLGYTSDFSIYDTDDSKSLIRSIVKERGLDDKIYKPNVVFNRISGAKNRLIGPDDYMNNPIISADDTAAKLPEMGKLYKIYATRCFQANAMDFDDLLFNTNLLFRDHPAVLDKYQRKFKYVMVDEFQDTNVSQYLIVKKLSDISRNLCVVGDDAQSIYAFRGASIDNILNLEKDYPNMTTIKLEQNYRSTQNIVEAANSIIAKNKNQLKKNVFTENEEGSLIELIKASSDNEEGRLVSTHIFESKMNLGLRNTDFAILYRTNAQSRTFEESLRKLNIKYRIIGGLSFYQRREIKDLLAYFRFVINQNDEEAFKRIINLPKRGIGDTTIAKITITAAEQQISVWEVVANIRQYQAGRFADTIEGFADLIKSFKIMVESQKKDAYEVASHIAKSSGLLRELHDDKTVEGLSRYENVQELLNSIKEFVDNPDTGTDEKNLATFLQNVSLMTTADEDDPDGDNDRVTMMTIHGAKGLEFNHVYVVGMEEDLFPSQMMLQSRADLEEERRLFYVAITRAEKKLMMSYAETRYQWGRLKPCEPSRFLDEIDPKYLQFAKNIRRAVEDTQRLPQGFVRMSNREQKMPDFNTPDTKTSVANLIRPSTSTRPAVTGSANTYKPSADFTPSDTKNLAEGDRVEHLKFGFGKVKKIDTNGTDRKAIIQFEGTIGEKTLLLSFAKLRIL
ncbi:DNA helicase-2/ATP-dependent DNA helicase PcrA [Arcicella aurantiaca]|uniref:DNA 3'-5' helicase n=1 Tax=Arcicella aurantiaca TaxID=591202 RepID=A0A316EC04_9BACT|nr:UvrD-helicase domain-containing protein [Arcicella aurantiaca]PWK27965.1 DNA helicase-2/ATP-dependent DNA helicase PcrA [Arcicella aurantiaca]